MASAVRLNFHRTVLARDDAAAVTLLNGLNMQEMLEALAAIGQPLRQRLLPAILAFPGGGMARIAYALRTVEAMAVPEEAPGDLAATGQTATARDYVALPAFTPQRFGTADAAARQFLAAVNPVSISQNREYWGLVVQSGAAFAATAPQRSADETAAQPVVAAAGGAVTAIIHTHGAGYGFVNGSTAGEMFSLDDRLVCKRYDLDGYLGTPAGSFLHLFKPPAAERGNLLSLGRVVAMP